MKRVLTLLLVLALVFGLCACGSSGESGGKASGLQVGYNRQSITPRGSVPLAGFANDLQRLSQGFLDNIYTTCVAFTEGDNTVLLFTEDMMGISASLQQNFCDTVSKATGVPKENIIFCDTHTHYAPSITAKSPEASAYLELYTAAIVKAAEEAMADRTSATLYAANVEVQGMNFTRHYLQSDGKITSSNTGNMEEDKVVDHARVADPEMVLLKAERSGDKKDIMLMNWAAHPCFRGDANSTSVSADFIGTTRDAFEKQTDMHFAFFQGASGDVVTDSRLPDKKNDLSCEDYGAKLAQYAVDAMPNMKKLEGKGIQTSRFTLEYALNRLDQHLLPQAQQVYAVYEQTKSTATATKLAKELGLITWTHARGIVNTSKNSGNGNIELNAWNIGGMSFASVPYEMFSQTGMYIKDNAPTEFTFVLGLANGKTNYVPIAEAYDYGCYESFSAQYAKGAAEASAEQLVKMLKDFQ